MLADVGCAVRMEPGVQSPDETLERAVGSCPDSAWLTPARHAVTCNGAVVPLQPTATPGTFVADVRFRAWQPPSALHPTIAVHAPLVFDVVDRWSERSLGGCTYRVVHPGGRAYGTLPVNANEAEAHRAARFSATGHTPGKIELVEERRDGEYPRTLDLRRAPAHAAAVSTPLAVVFAKRRGVSQDFAHVAIACLRSLGLPARYVSGYMETDPPPGRPKLTGADVSHAWASVLVPGAGWLDFDPTNDQLVNHRYVVTAYGRDYSDVPPLNGVIFSEGRTESMKVVVDVVALPG